MSRWRGGHSAVDGLAANAEFRARLRPPRLTDQEAPHAAAFVLGGFGDLVQAGLTGAIPPATVHGAIVGV